MSATTIEAVLKRDRAVVLCGLVLVSALAWGYVLHGAWGMKSMDVSGTEMSMDMGMEMSMPQTQAWLPLDLLLLFLMWAVMMVAMMVPSAAPMILVFAAVNRKRRERQRPFVPTAVFLMGYLAVWSVFSAAAALAQWLFHNTALLSPMMVSTSPVFGGGLLLAAGVFQWTPLKHACLNHCRSPLSFLTSDWREGRGGAFMMGLRHGTYCVGCCWVLMGLLFVTGVMNILWIALIAAFVLVEKVAPDALRPWVSRGAGMILVAWGLSVLLAALRSWGN